MLPYIEFRFLVTTHIFFYFSLCLEASLKIYVYMMNSLKLLIMKIRVLQVFEIIAMFARNRTHITHVRVGHYCLGKGLHMSELVETDQKKKVT